MKVVFADKEKVIGEVRDYVARLRRCRSDVEKVGLFGSYANDSFGPASDVDLLIVLKDSDKRFLDRIAEFIPDEVGVGCDVFPYTEAELERMRAEDSGWIRHILEEVIWL